MQSDLQALEWKDTQFIASHHTLIIALDQRLCDFFCVYIVCYKVSENKNIIIIKYQISKFMK